MSIWTHVNAAFRIDAFMEDIDFESVFGKELHYDDDASKWDDAFDNPNEYLPLGSEGSLSMSIWANPDKACMAKYTVTIFGDLRDVEDAQGVVEDLMARLDTADLMVRQAFISATLGFDGSQIYAIRNEDESWELNGFTERRTEE